MTQKYLIALDMDGTLLNSQGKITEKTVHVLQELLDAGHYVAPASGRALSLLPQEIHALRGLQYGVLENGAVVWDYEKKEALYTRFLPEGVAEEILNGVREQYQKQIVAGDGFHYYTEVIVAGVVYAEQNDVKWYETAAIEGNFAEYMMADHEYVSDIHEKTRLLQHAEKINLYFEDTGFAERIRKQWRHIPGICVTTSVKGNAEFMAEGVNKGIGIAKLKELLGLDASQVIAIGDNENDVEMFAQAGISVAMGNAAECVKRRASYVTTDNDHDGAVVFLQKFLMND